MEIDIFIPCLVDQFYPETGFNMIKVLQTAGCNVNYNEEQTCCGMPAFHSGFRDQASEVGEKFLNDFEGDRPIVCAGSACTGMVLKDYEELFGNTVWRNKYKTVKKRMFEFSEFLVDKLHKVELGATLNRKAVFQDACSALHWCGIDKQPRKLLQHVNGLHLVELDDREMCCGFGGSFAAKFVPASLELARLKIENVKTTGADLIITAESGCLMHLRRYLADKDLGIEVMHLADVLASRK